MIIAFLFNKFSDTVFQCIFETWRFRAQLLNIVICR